MKELSLNILKTFSSQIPTIIIGVFSGVFLTRLLGVEGKGAYAILVSNIEIMTMLFALGAGMGIEYFGSNNKIDIYKLQGLAFGMLFLFIPLVVLLVLTFESSFLFPDHYDDNFFKLFLLILFSCSLTNAVLGAFIKAKKGFKFINRISLFNSTLSLVLFSGAYFIQQNQIYFFDFKFVFSLSIILATLTTTMFLLSFVKSNTFKPNFNLSVESDLIPFFKYTSPAFISLLINFLNYRLDVWIVSYVKGNFQLGLYMVAVGLAQFVLLFSRILGGVLMPYLSENNLEQRIKYFTIYSRVNFISVILILVGLASLGQVLIPFMYGSDFSSSIQPFLILLVGMIFTAMSQIFSIFFYSKGLNKIVLLANFIGLLSTAIFDIILIPKYGINGAALATVFSYFVLFCVLLFYLTYKEKIKFIDLFFIRKSDAYQLFRINKN